MITANPVTIPISEVSQMWKQRGLIQFTHFSAATRDRHEVCRSRQLPCETSAETGPCSTDQCPAKRSERAAVSEHIPFCPNRVQNNRVPPTTTSSNGHPGGVECSKATLNPARLSSHQERMAVSSHSGAGLALGRFCRATAAGLP
jgi:hypothetical protein